MVDFLGPQIDEMKAKGMSNNDIVQALQRQGYTSTQIFDALGQGSAPRPSPRVAQQYAPPPEIPQRSVRLDDTEELIEAIIDEKWNDLMGDINKVIAWKDAMESRITKMEQQLTDTRKQFDTLHQAVVGKIGEYDQHILDVGAEVKAMEKVFSKVLPVFTDNVAELSRITDQMKKK